MTGKLHLNEKVPISVIHLLKVHFHVVETALKACKAMGDGLYGVDFKESNGKVYVIEVNDNPNIDF